MYVPARARAIALGAGGAIALALAPRPLAHAVLAATAGTLFEAAPFALFASLIPARLLGAAALASCGCGGRGAPPGALAPVAIAVCWLSFGPGIAIARFAAAAMPSAVRGLRSRRTAATHDAAAVASPPVHGDATFATLWGVAGASAATALLMPHLGALAAEPVAAAVAGLALGAIVPCATAGVAVAAGYASRDPWLAAGILATAGVVPFVDLPHLRLRRGASGTRVAPWRMSGTSAASPRSPAADFIREKSEHAPAAGRARVRPAESPAPRDARFALALLAVALAVLAFRGGAGLVHPRLVPFAALAAVVAGVRAVRPAIHAGRRAAVLPAIMLAALVAGSPEPPYVADEATAVDGFPGEPVAFTGVAHAGAAATRLVRFSIACCRLDAGALAITLDRRLAVRDGTWLRVRGRFTLRAGRLVVHADRVAAVPKPPDPFVYR